MQYDFLINLPAHIFSCHTFDVTSYYEAIPHEGCFSLLESLAGLFKFCSSLKYSRFLLNKAGKASFFDLSLKSYFICFQFFLELNKWVLYHCFIQLGPLIKKKIKGIPMGYSCSPLWCNLYLTFFELSFINRLASLHCNNILPSFKLSFRFIDDLDLINNPLSINFEIRLKNSSLKTLFGFTFYTSLILNSPLMWSKA